MVPSFTNGVLKMLRRTLVVAFLLLGAASVWAAQPDLKATATAQKEIAPKSSCLFVPGDFMRLELPREARGKWLIIDGAGKPVRQGEFQSGERALYMGDLQRGIYYLYWSVEGKGVPPTSSPPENRTSFLVLPKRDQIPVDHYFAVNQPGAAASGAPSADYAFLLHALERMGVRRLRTGFSRGSVFANPKKADWSGFDRLVNDTIGRNIRLIAVLAGDGPSSSTLAAETAKSGEDFIQALMRRFGFKFDKFALWQQPNSANFNGTVEEFLARAGPWYRRLKVRSRYCTVALGGLVSATTTGTARFAGPDDFLPKILGAGAGNFDLLDHEAPGSLQEAKALAAELDRLAQGSTAEGKERAISGAEIGCGDDSLDGQRYQAVETVKKLVWFRFRDYRYFASARLLDPVEKNDPTAGRGMFARGDRPGRFRPRMLAAAWVEAQTRLGGAKPVTDTGFSGEQLEMYAFARKNETIVVAWAPLLSNDTRADKRVAATLIWPDEAKGEVFDLLGANVTQTRLRKRAESERYLLVDPEPVYVVIQAPSGKVTW